MSRVFTRGVFVLAIVLATALAGLIGGAERAWAANCSNTQLVPDIAELMVSQGAPGYPKLARGKEAIVRAYLRNPTTCTVTSKQAITPVSASLSVSYLSPVTDPAPAPLTNFQPLSGKLLPAAQDYSTADPFFVVPASYLAPATTGQFNVTFTLTLTYTRTGSTAPSTTTTGPNAVTATVNQRTNALRVLIVPMGDRTSTNVQWSTAAEATLNTVMSNTARALPVPTGAEGQLATVPFGARIDGLRYRISGDLLDVKALGLYTTAQTPSQTKFCANGSSWKTVQPGATGVFAGKTLKGELQERLTNYNAQNTPPADMVLGVIDGALAWKSADQGVICDDGRAATPDPTARTPGQVGWVRVDTGSYPTPLQMELAHTIGIAPTGSFHGAEVETDQGFTPTRVNRVYNVLLGKVIKTGTLPGELGTNDHSIMNGDTSLIPYTKDNTLAYFRDWDAALCDLSPNPVGCAISTAIGTDQGVAAGSDMYKVVGTVTPPDSTAPSVNVITANRSEGDGEMGVALDGTSRLLLKLCVGPCGGTTPAVITRDIPLSLTSQAPIDEDHQSAGPGTEPETFSALVSLTVPLAPPGTLFTCAELRLDGALMFTSACEGDPAPDVESVSTVAAGTVLRSFRPHSFVFSTDDVPTRVDLCCNGRAVAFDGTDLYITVTSEEASENLYIFQVSTDDGLMLGSRKTGTGIGALAYDAATGRFYGGDYDFDTATPTGTVWDIDYNGEEDVDTGEIPKTALFTFSDTAACEGNAKKIDGLEYLSGSPKRLALSGDICDTVFLKTLPDGSPASPPWIPTDNNSGITTDGATGLWLARLNTEGAFGGTRLTHVAIAGTPLSEFVISGYEAEDLAYDSVTFAPNCAVWMNEATFEEPTVQAVAVPCPGGTVQEGVKVKTTNAAFVTLYAVCGTPADATDPEVEKFSLGTYVPDANGETIVPFTDERFCANATIVVEASNTWATTGLTDPDGSVSSGAAPQVPTVNIASPLNSSTVRRTETIRYEGDAWDPEDGAIADQNCAAGQGPCLRWYDNGNLIAAGTGKPSFDLAVAANAPVGSHVIKLEATASDGTVRSATVTITIRPKLCTTTAGC
jgi:hypothetical protein